jgi:hypothetical protein
MTSESEVIIERLENPDYWDDALESFQGGIFMTTAWITAMSNNERRPVYLRFIKDDKPVAFLGGLDIYIKNGPGRQLFFYSGITSAIHYPSFISRCKIALYNYARNNGYQRISIRSYDYQSFVPARAMQFKVRRERMEYVFRLDRDNDSITNGFSRSVRQRASKARREGAILKKGHSPELVEKLFSLINETSDLRTSKGYGAYTYLFLPFFTRTEIERLVKEKHASIYYTELHGEILTIELFIEFKNKACGILMGTSQKGYKAGSPSFHYFELVRLLKDKGYSYYNVGGVPRSNKHKGLREFKGRLGAEVIASAEEVTNFMRPALSYLNPILDFKRFLRGIKFLPGRIKRPFMFFADLIVQKRDQY